jgi:ATP-dependent helicase/nuclease subunit A
MKDLLTRDAASRRRALEPASFIVEAPAGAGKTELLTQRFLMLLSRVEEPEEIVAITFTRKAAAEMRGRILESLETAAAGLMPGAEHKRVTYALARAALAVSSERGWGLPDNPARLRVTTIDALCAGLARQMPLLSRFGGEPRVVEDARRHYEEAARRTLALLAEAGEEGDAVAAALAHLDNDTERLARLLEDMLAKRDQWLGYAVNHPPYATARQALKTLVERELAQVADVMEGEMPEPLMTAASFAADNVGDDSPIAALRDWQEPLDGDPARLRQWRGLGELLLTREGTPRKQLTKNQGLPPGKEGESQKKALKEFLERFPDTTAAALARVRLLPDPELGEEEWQTVTALAQLLKLAAATLWQVFREAGEVDFVEVAQRALVALGGADDPTDLALLLDYRIRHLLVDEFQDTSPAQVDLLSRITAGWMADDGRTLFLVGDPMQSIYRFRKAEVGLFLEALNEGIGGLRLDRLSLYRNNRSCGPVVEWVNEAFAQVFPTEDAVDEGAIEYRPFAATQDSLPGAGVFVHALVGPKENADRREALRILKIIDDTWCEDPKRSIAVLVKAKKHLAPLAAEIRRHRPDLRFTAVEIERLSERQPVQDLLALTHALHHRADRVNWLAILRAPWCGLTLHDLHALAGDDHLSTVWSLMNDEARLARLSNDGSIRLRHGREVLAEAFAQRGRQRPRRWIEAAWLALGGAACLETAADGADANAFLDLVDRLDAAGRFTAETVEEETENLFAAPDARADGRLQFMSIHKAKGLEFDTVIVPGLHRKPRSGDQPLLLWEPVLLDDFREGLVAAPMRRGARKEPTLYGYLKELEKDRSSHEAERLLYVAATRAKRALHWVGHVVPDAKGEIGPATGSLLALLWPVIDDEFAKAPVEETGAEGSPGSPPIPPLRRLAAVAVPECLRHGTAGPAQLVDVGGEAAEGEGDPPDAHVGILVHTYLELVARQGLDAWPTEGLRRLRPAMLAWLAQQGCAAAECNRGADRAVAVLTATLESEDGRWVLAAREDAAAELSLTRAGGEGASLHIVDRTFVEDGVRWIVDYKTAAVAGVPAVHAERYRGQLTRYAGLFQNEGQPIRMGVFYTAIGKLIELP